jgi:hypothetical protein
MQRAKTQMSIKPIREDLFVPVCAAVEEGLEAVRRHVGEKKYVGQYYRFPTLSKFDSGFPQFGEHYLSSGPLEYEGLFRDDEKAPINRLSLVTWRKFAEKVESDAELVRFFKLNEPSEYPEVPDWTTIHRNYCFYSPISHFVSRVIHLTGKMDFDESAFLPIYREWENSLSTPKLPISIWIPILLAKFNFDSAPMGHAASIEKISDELQLARNKRRTHNDSSHETVIGAATHALVLRGWEIPNSTQGDRMNLLAEFSAFSPAVEIIDKFFAAFRAVTGVSTGYSQLVIVPEGWSHTWQASLMTVSVVSTRAYPDHFEKFGWLKEPVPVDEPAAKEVEALFSRLRTAKEHKLAIATRRLNTAYLRRDDSDSILDLAIGLESLLVGDSNSEITHKLALRVAALSGLDGWPEGSPVEIFGAVKRIYAYRSAVVHGTGDAEKKRVITVGKEKKHDAVELGLALLRHTLTSLAKHPEFLDPSALDAHLLKSTAAMTGEVSNNPGKTQPAESSSSRSSSSL